MKHFQRGKNFVYEVWNKKIKDIKKPKRRGKDEFSENILKVICFEAHPKELENSNNFHPLQSAYAKE